MAQSGIGQWQIGSFDFSHPVKESTPYRGFARMVRGSKQGSE
jgi:hypothetical protein